MMRNSFIAMIVLLVLSSCGKKERDYTKHNNNPGSEYAPQMYISTPYEPYSQKDGNTLNPDGQNMRRPPAGTVARTMDDNRTLSIELMSPYPFHKDSLDMAAALLTNPVMNSDKVLGEGEYLYNAYCEHCHGSAGAGDGLVAEKYLGVANLTSPAFANVSSGHLYHVISAGKGRMYGHASQILPADRWKIVHYVNTLRKYDDRQDPVRVLTDYELSERTEIIEDEESIRILFPFGSSVASPNTKLNNYLGGIAERIKSEGSSLAIEGHTDNVDTREVNLEVGQKRADYIKDLLLEMGVDATSLTTNSKSFDEPVADNNTVDGRRQNRRVELIFN